MALLLFILGFFLTSGGDDAPYFHEVRAKNGDGIYSLLRRYDLADAPCNIQQFYALNDLSGGEDLIRNRSYKLPVLIYRYNGQSIRSTIGIDDWDLAIRIQKYNESLQQKGLRITSYRESKILWVPYHEVHCNTDIPVENTAEAEAKSAVPAKSESSQVIFSLLGKEYEKVDIEDRSLAGEVYYIVSGHGGPDPGAVAYKVNNEYDLCEDEYAYDVSLRMARALLKKGATVHMIIEDANDGIRQEAFLECDKDETCGGERIPLNQLKRLQQRADRINYLYKQHEQKGATTQKVICIHVDSRGEHKRQDVFFYYYGKSRTGKTLATNLHQTFNEKYLKYQSSRGYHGTLSARPLYMLRKTNAPAVYVELANIRNAKDRKRLVRESNREALANWLAEGLSK